MIIKKHMYSAIALLAGAVSAFAQGTLVPPLKAFDGSGAPAPIMKTLEQIEPRRLISSLPYTITNSGSYYVAGNLVGTNGQHGIVINADNVQLDLNGFALMGRTNEMAATNLTLTGIEISDDPIHKSITIRNGVVFNWGRYGIRSTLAEDCRIEDVTVNSNGGTNSFDGMSLGAGWIVSGCRVQDNKGDGISTTGNCMIHKTIIKDNHLNGLNLAGEAVVADCTSSSNLKDGIVVGNSSIVRDCLVINNSTNGIVAGDGCLIRNNNCSYNGGGAGIRAGYSCRIDSNHLRSNQTGVKITDGASKSIVLRNTAVWNGGGTANYDLTTDTVYGQILTSEDLGGGFTNHNPWANFSL